jgi:hypothetical protein
MAREGGQRGELGLDFAITDRCDGNHEQCSGGFRPGKLVGGRQIGHRLR